MKPRGKIGGVLNFIKEKNFESNAVKKGIVSGLLISTFALTLLTTSSVIGEENKVYAKSNQTDSNVLMRGNATKDLKKEFEKQIQNIEKESSKKTK